MRGGESCAFYSVCSLSECSCVRLALNAGYCHRCVLLQKNQREFDVECSISGRAYHISDPQGGASMWADLINAVLQESRPASTVRVTSLAR
jgi:hypothetical protein